jgi:hypothetical protein
MKTWPLKVGERILSLKMLKDEAKHFQYYTLDRVMHVQQYQRERYGTIEADGTTTDDDIRASMIIGLPAFMLSEEGKAERTAFITELPEVITAADIPAIKEKAQAFYDKWVPVTDKRETRTQREADAIENKKREADMQAKRKAEADKFLSVFGSEETVQIPKGALYFEIEANYDNSDIMSDYFATASYGVPMFLAFAPGGPRREENYRHAVDRYEALKGLSWKWERHEYSMGRGTWLQSSAAGETEGVKTYGGHENPSFVWEVRVQSARGDMTLPAFKGFNPDAVSSCFAETEPTETTGPITVRKNEVHNGVEIVFSAKPPEAVREGMKSQGFRWSGRQGLWYAKFTSGRYEYAKTLAQEVVEK